MGANTVVTSTIAIAALGLAAVAAAAMLYRAGRPRPRFGKAALWLHRFAGYGAGVLFIVMMLGMIVRTATAPGEMPPRAAWHGAAGLVLGAALLLKWAVVRPFRGLAGLAPALGMTVLVAAFVVVVLAAAGGGAAPRPAVAGVASDVTAYRGLTAEKCGRCHHLAVVFEKSRGGEEWAVVIERMRGYDRGWINDEETKNITTYLVSAQAR